jgi:thioredoxin-related protein
MLDEHADFLLLKEPVECKLHTLTALLTKRINTEIFQNTCGMRGFLYQISLMVTYRKSLGLKKGAQKCNILSTNPVFQKFNVKEVPQIQF